MVDAPLKLLLNKYAALSYYADNAAARRKVPARPWARKNFPKAVSAYCLWEITRSIALRPSPLYRTRLIGREPLPRHRTTGL